MTIKQKIILSSVFNGALIAIIGLYSFQNLNLILTKLKFIEIADNLNTSLLEMKLAEKDYFLYKNPKALSIIKSKIDQIIEVVDRVQNNIIQAIGERNLEKLEFLLEKYSVAVNRIRDANKKSQMREVRRYGKSLKEFSETMMQLEKERSNNIIIKSQNMLLYSFGAILIFFFIASHFISRKIIRSLGKVENLAASIANGNYNKIEEIETRDELGEVIRAINSMSEELAKREEQIIQTKKLASIGVLTAGVAHELNNPLNNISMIAQTYIELYDNLKKEDRIELMHKVDEETERIRKIVKNLLEFSKPKEVNPKESGVNEIINNTLNLVQNMLDISNIDTKLELATELPHIYVDRHQIKQVLVNLVNNAAQAMPSGGRLYISSRLGNKDDTIEILVKDTGKGIPAEYLSHVFDPFFTTKGEKGTGLGLSVSYGIIKKHNGTIRVDSKPGIGTTFTIELPVYNKNDNGREE